MGWLTANVEGNQNSGLHFMFRFESVCQFCVLKIHTHTHTGSEWSLTRLRLHRLRTAGCWLKTHISIELEERTHTHTRRLTGRLESDSAQTA